ncbi:hypothetical protein HKX48_001988 [Thoreauomyces humboldtii]|nr:hypothetical protein HKX48_001988 [Thoreauomyces humboldtii]
MDPSEFPTPIEASVAGLNEHFAPLHSTISPMPDLADLVAPGPTPLHNPNFEPTVVLDEEDRRPSPPIGRQDAYASPEREIPSRSNGSPQADEEVLAFPHRHHHHHHHHHHQNHRDANEQQEQPSASGNSGSPFHEGLSRGEKYVGRALETAVGIVQKVASIAGLSEGGDR